MKDSFHGTATSFASVLVAGRVAVALGRGEFGRGFYVQDSSANAMRWAVARSGVKRACVVEFRIASSQYSRLSRRLLTLEQARNLTASLRASGTKRTYLANVDILEGPLNGDLAKTQAKFESGKAESALNDKATLRKVI